jgi:putative transposase
VYQYRSLTPEQRQAVVDDRKRLGHPWHRPPHPDCPGEWRLVSAACFEHRHFLQSTERLAWFQGQLFEALTGLGTSCAAWCVLPNHYHALVQIADMKRFGITLGRLHGRSSFRINREDRVQGRRVWYDYEDRCMRGEAHFFTTINYIHNNPVKHGYVRKWQEWPFSSVHWYLEVKGRDWMLDLWRDYPVLNYGDKWDAG